MLTVNDYVRDYVLRSTVHKKRMNAAVFARTHAESPEVDERVGWAPPYASDPYSVAGQRWQAIECHGTRLPTDLPTRIGTVEEVLCGSGIREELSWLERLSLVLRFTNGPLRWEPLALNSQHRAVASPRSLFLCELRVVIARAGQIATMRYLPEMHALGPAVECAGAPQCGQGDTFSIAVVGMPARCIRPYGEFSPVLVALEAGLVSAELALMCSAVGWRCCTAVAFDHAIASRSLGLRDLSELPLAMVVVTNEPRVESCAVAGGSPFRTLEMSPPRRELEAYPAVRELIRRSELRDADAVESLRAELRRRAPSWNDSGGAASRAPREPPLEHDFLEVVQRRSSGSLDTGQVFNERPIDAATLGSMAWEWHRYSELLRASELWGVNLRCDVWALEPGTGTALRYQIDPATARVAGPREHLDAERLTRLFYGLLNFREMSLVVVFSADYAEEFDALGTRAFFLVHQAAGEWAQTLALVLARRGLFARPVRAYEDGEVERTMGLTGTVVLQLVCGLRRRCAPQMEIG